MSGVIFSKNDVRDYRAICALSSNVLPKSFELKFFNNSIIKNQKNVNSCVAHALSTIIEYYNKIQNNINLEMSTGYIYGNRKTSIHKKQSMILRDALAAVQLYGDVYATSFPYNNIEAPTVVNKFEEQVDKLYEEGYVNRISSYCRLRNEKEIKTMLMEGKPVLIAMKWYGDMKVVNGILTTSYKNYKYGHCMVIYGWDENGWKVQNSWGKSWGDNGRCIVKYDTKGIKEIWAIIDTIVGTNIEIKKPYSTMIGRKVAIAVNKICHLFNK